VVEQWTEIVNHEPGTVALQRMASTRIAAFARQMFYLTHFFFGDFTQEMLAPFTEQITPGMKVLDSKLGVRADQFQNPSFIISLERTTGGKQRSVFWAGSLEWSGSFSMRV